MGSHSPTAAVRGHVALLTGAILLGTGHGLARLLMNRGASYVELTWARWSLGTLIAILVLRSWRTPIAAVAPSARRRVLGLSAFLGITVGVSTLAYYRALTTLPVAVAAVLIYTAPVYVVLWKWVVHREPPHVSVLAGVALALVGVALLSGLSDGLSGGRGKVDPVGLGAALLAAFVLAGWFISGERLARYAGAGSTLVWSSLFASASLCLIQVARGWPRSLAFPGAIPGVLYLALLGTVIPFLLMFWGLQHVDARRAGIVSMVEVCSAALCRYLWLDQSLTVLQVAGGAMVLAGGLVVRERRASAGPVGATTAERAMPVR